MHRHEQPSSRGCRRSRESANRRTPDGSRTRACRRARFQTKARAFQPGPGGDLIAVWRKSGVFDFVVVFEGNRRWFAGAQVPDARNLGLFSLEALGSRASAITLAPTVSKATGTASLKLNSVSGEPPFVTSETQTSPAPLVDPQADQQLLAVARKSGRGDLPGALYRIGEWLAGRTIEQLPATARRMSRRRSARR